MTYLVLPIAGLSSRFGSLTSKPKWALSVGGHTVLERALQSVLLEQPLGISKVIFVVHESHLPLLKSLSFQGRPMSDLGQIVTVNHTPNGQALSASKALTAIPTRKGFFIWNGDTAISPGWAENVTVSENWLLVSRLAGDHWSFVEAKNGKVFRTAEKERISSLASLGLYRFEHKELFMKALTEQSDNLGEAFVAPLYNQLLAKEAVTASEVDSRLFQALGTPRELMLTCIRNGWSIPDEMTGFDPF